MKRQVITTYVEMTSPQGFLPKTFSNSALSVQKVEVPNPALNHFFFVHVGQPWRWTSRLSWDYSDWKAWLATEGVSTWVASTQGAPCGYIEFHEVDSAVEIKFFGLLPQYVGQGLGGIFLSEALRIAWSFAPQRVWLHTCTLDHKYALKNYLARGFVVYDQEVEMEDIPEDDDLWATPHYYQSLIKEFEALAQESAEKHPETQNVDAVSKSIKGDSP